MAKCICLDYCHDEACPVCIAGHPETNNDDIFWTSSFDTCNICNMVIKNKVEYFVDGKTKTGPWALMCPECFKKHGIAIGYGTGQKYDASTGKLLEGGCDITDDE